MSERAPVVPTLIRLLDLLAVVSLMIGVTVFLTGGFREWTPLGRLSVTSWVRPVVFAGVVLLFRHWRLRQPTIIGRARITLARARSSPEFLDVLPIVLSTRTGVFLVGFLAIALFGFPVPQVPWRIYENEILNLPARWDTGWYLGVAIDGYSWAPSRDTFQQNIAFFPVYPMLMRYSALLFGRETMWTGVLISWVSFFAASMYLIRLARLQLGPHAAAPALAFLACYPFAVFYSTAYTESLFLLTLVGACYSFEREQWWKAATWGLVAGLTRPNGCLLSVVLGLMAIRPLWDNAARSWMPTTTPDVGWPTVMKRLAVAAMPGVGMLTYSAYIYSRTGNPLQWAVQNAAWGRVYRGLDSLVSQHAQTIGERGLYTYAATSTLDALQLVAVLFVLATVWPVYRRLGVPYAALILVNVVPPLMMGGLLSMGRVTAVLFPAFLWLGAAVPANHRPAWLAVFAMLQAVCAAVFFTWRPLY